MQDYSVTLIIEAAEPLTEAALTEVAAIGGAAGGNLGERRLDTTLTVEADSVAAAVAGAADRFAALGRVVAADAVTTAEADRRLSLPPFPELVGAAEVATMLGITRQRFHALRRRHELPAPVALLAAGPVWRKADLSTFADGWQRKAGRPRKEAA